MAENGQYDDWQPDPATGWFCEMVKLLKHL